MSKIDKPTIIIRGEGSPKIAIVGSIHGDEPVGSNIITALKKYKIKKGEVRMIIGNQNALKKKKRYIIEDLNRCFPGDKKGKGEKVLAYNILKEIQDVDYCIDIHSTTTNTHRAIIIKRKTRGVKKLISLFNPEHVVGMPRGAGDGALINYCKAGISFEYGKHNSRSTYTESLRDILVILRGLGILEEKKQRGEIIRKTTYYSIYGTEQRPESFVMRNTIVNFKRIVRGDVLGRVGGKKILAQDSFYPVLFGPKSYKDIMGFKAKKETSSEFWKEKR